MTYRRPILLTLCVYFLVPHSVATAQEMISTLTLDGNSYISFGDREILPLPSGSTIRFRFGDPAADGSIPLTIWPSEVSIDPIPVPSRRGTLAYTIASRGNGSVQPQGDSRKLAFTATVRATLKTSDGGGSYDYTIPFTTETASAKNADGGGALSVTGTRLAVDSSYVRIVGATTNKRNAFPEPGAAVYTVLSGSFDRVPW